MKNIILIVFALLCANIEAQTYRMNENDKKAIIKISPEVYNTVYRVEKGLDKNSSRIMSDNFDIENPYINSISQAYSNYKISESKIKKIEAILCLECYSKEWSIQESKKTKYLQKKERIKDSLEQLRIKEFQDLKNIKNKEVGNQTLVQKDRPYDLLQRSLYAFSKTNRSLAVFRGMDYNYSAPNLSGYLQSEMGLASKDFKIGENEVMETFIPKVSKGNEYLTVKYSVTKRNDVVGIYDSEEVMLINSVEITGTPDLLINLFINYWPQKIKFTSYKKGEIAFQELLGDHISIIGVSPTLYKIKISKGNMDINYGTTYGINRIK